MERLIAYLGRRWAWLLVGALVGGFLGVGSTFVRSDAWVADSLVVLTDARIPPEEFSAVATAIFPTEPVVGSVISDLRLDETPGSLVSSGALEVRTAPGGLAVRIVARTQDEELSIALANAAAAALAEVGEDNGLGEIAQFPGQDARREKDPIVLAGLAGMLLGTILVAAVLSLRYLVARRGAADEERSDADVTVRVRVAAPRADGNEAPVVTPEHALEGLVRGFMWTTNGDPVPGLTLDDGPSGWAVHAVAEQLDALGREASPSARFTWSSASRPLPRTPGRIAVIAPQGAGARLDDVRRMLAERRPGTLVALVIVDAADLS